MSEPVDYTGGNARKNKDSPANEKIEALADDAAKKIEAVIDTKVIVKKKGIGSRIKAVIVHADIPGVITNVIYDTLIPAARSMVAETLIEGVTRAFFPGERSRHVGRSMWGGAPSRVTYNEPIRRMGGSPLSPRNAPPQSSILGTRRRMREDYIISSRREAELVLERLRDVLDKFQVVSVLDLKELLGLETNPIDNKWGWAFLTDASVVATRDGFILDLPPEEPLQ